MSPAKVNKTGGYGDLVKGMVALLGDARRQTARSVNAILTATYWEMGRRIVEFEQEGAERATYGEELLKRLAEDLTSRFGRGFSRRNLQQMRLFYQAYPQEKIWQTLSAKFHGSPQICQTPSAKSGEVITADPRQPPMELAELASAFPLSWSHYVLLITRTHLDDARRFYETEALRGGWSVRQLERQINSQFYERTALSRNKAAMLQRGAKSKAEDRVSPEEEIKDPYVLEFLGLKDEYSETDLEEGLIRHLESFLLELGGDFTFVARQKRLRVGDEWYRVDLVFFHRRLRCLVLIDLKLGKFTHADAGQMHLYLNYARENWTLHGENLPVGLILCAYKDRAVAKYALEGLPNKVLAAEYKTALPDEKLIAAELERTRRALDKRRPLLSRPVDGTVKGTKDKKSK
jgi:predicted nuclease of restriction endonuclease-like (RecB) superfamily